MNGCTISVVAKENCFDFLRPYQHGIANNVKIFVTLLKAGLSVYMTLLY